ncbi:MAG: hypothetical protein ABI408_03475 [Gemmatimonadaceae bacterium]
MSVRRVVREGGGDDTYNDIEVSLPSRDVESVERSSTSVSRGFLTAGAIVATALLAANGSWGPIRRKDRGKHLDRKVTATITRLRRSTG